MVCFPAKFLSKFIIQIVNFKKRHIILGVLVVFSFQNLCIGTRGWPQSTVLQHLPMATSPLPHVIAKEEKKAERFGKTDAGPL